LRIAQLTPGTGSFHCGSCLRDNVLVRELRAQGHDVVMVPMYLPVVVEDRDESAGTPVLFGGINVYLQSLSALFRWTPSFLDRVWDTGPMLRLAAARSGMTHPRELGPLTLSMLRGESGDQKKELDRLARWLEEHGPFDVVAVSNALLIGLARGLKARLGVPVVCTLQGEDSFLDALPEPSRTECWRELAARTADVDALVAVSGWYRGVMSARLSVSESRITAVANGISLEGWPDARPERPTVGYLARMCPEKGLHVLVEAFLRVAKEIPDARLGVAGAVTGLDVPYVDEQKRKLAQAGLADRVDFLPNVTLEEKRAFLSTLSLLSVPATYEESFGLYVLEALASGVPVVETTRGGLPEVVEATQGGVLVPPDDPAALADAIAGLLRDEPRRLRFAAEGRDNVRARFNASRMAAQVAEVFAKVVQSQREGRA
jgi:glycosyltransferase involved in cell wall biosynthesis